MAAFIVPSGAQVRLYWSHGGWNFMNVLGAAGTTSVTITQAIADSLDTAIKSAFVTSGLQSHYQNLTLLNAVSVRDVKANTFPEFKSSGAPVSGTSGVASELLPLSSSLVVTFKTAMAGKSYRGRIYLPPMSEAANEGNAGATAATITDAQTFIAGIRSALSTAGLAHAILSPALPADRYPSDPPVAAKPAFATTVDSFSVRSPLWGSMRSRSQRP